MSERADIADSCRPAGVALSHLDGGAFRHLRRWDKRPVAAPRDPRSDRSDVVVGLVASSAPEAGTAAASDVGDSAHRVDVDRSMAGISSIRELGRSGGRPIHFDTGTDEASPVMAGTAETAALGDACNQAFAVVATDPNSGGDAALHTWGTVALDTDRLVRCVRAIERRLPADEPRLILLDRRGPAQ